MTRRHVEVGRRYHGQFAGEELEKIGIIRSTDILDSIVIHVPKTYPGYFGTYHDLMNSEPG